MYMSQGEVAAEMSHFQLILMRVPPMEIIIPKMKFQGWFPKRKNSLLLIVMVQHSRVEPQARRAVAGVWGSHIHLGDTAVSLKTFLTLNRQLYTTCVTMREDFLEEEGFYCNLKKNVDKLVAGMRIFYILGKCIK